MTQIKGGYYIKARKIQESKIAHCSPCVREVFDWLIREANHADTKVCLRGQTVRRISDIVDGLHWYVGWRKMTYSKADCENAMKALRKMAMIATRKTARGALITVLNYDKYQRPENYDSRIESRTTAERIAAQLPNYKQEREEKRMKEENNVPPSAASGFEKFWTLYPRKTAKKTALHSWLKAKPDGAEEAAIFSAIERQSKSDQWTKDGGRFIPHAATWLNQERWKDELPAKSTLSTKFDSLKSTPI